jgi:hypothetical protein
MTTNYVVIPDFDYKGQPMYVAVTLTYKLTNVKATVSSTAVAISGSAPGLLNIEVWDANSKSLLQMKPDSLGNFKGTIPTTNIATGGASWTVYGWDSAPGQPFSNSDTLAISVTVTH